jgi:hypothetical protein
MTLAEMNRQQVIEVVASAFFRVTGFTYLLSAFSNLWHLEADIAYVNELGRPPTRYDLHLHQLLIMDIIYNVTIALLMILMTVALSRLVCRGLQTILEFKKQP